MNDESHFLIGTCYQKVIEGRTDYDYLYCSGNTLIMVLTGINTVLLSYFLFLHIKLNWHSEIRWYSLFIKVKTLILMLLLLFELIAFLRYTCSIGAALYNIFLVVQ